MRTLFPPKIVLLVLLGAMALSPSASAAMTVTDPGAYVYFGKEIEQMVEQINQLKAMKEGTFGRLEEINKQVSGQFEGLKGVYDQLNTAQKDLQGLAGSVKPPTTLQEAAQRWTTLKDLSKGQEGSGKVLDETFRDPRAGGKDDIKYLNRQYDLRQNSLKAAIQKSEELLQDVPTRLENVGKLIEAASKAKSQADKQDMTNAILIEMLRTLTIYQSTLVQFAQADALLKYTGVDQKAMQQRENVLWPIKKAAEAVSGSDDSFGDISEGAKKYGVDSNNPESLKGRDVAGDMAQRVKL